MTRHRRFCVNNRLVHPIEWRSFADQLDTLRELKDFLTVDGVLQKVDLLGAYRMIFGRVAFCKGDSIQCKRIESGVLCCPFYFCYGWVPRPVTTALVLAALPPPCSFFFCSSRRPLMSPHGLVATREHGLVGCTDAVGRRSIYDQVNRCCMPFMNRARRCVVRYSTGDVAEPPSTQQKAFFCIPKRSADGHQCPAVFSDCLGYLPSGLLTSTRCWCAAPAPVCCCRVFARRGCRRSWHFRMPVGPASEKRSCYLGGASCWHEEWASSTNQGKGS